MNQEDELLLLRLCSSMLVLIQMIFLFFIIHGCYSDGTTNTSSMDPVTSSVVFQEKTHDFTLNQSQDQEQSNNNMHNSEKEIWHGNKTQLYHSVLMENGILYQEGSGNNSQNWTSDNYNISATNSSDSSNITGSAELGPKKSQGEFNLQFLAVCIMTVILLMGGGLFTLQKYRTQNRNTCLQSGDVTSESDNDKSHHIWLHDNYGKTKLAYKHDTQRSVNQFTPHQKKIIIIGGSTQGSSHLKGEIPCQDACSFLIQQDEIIFIAVADGLGSAEHSDTGSTLAVTTSINSLISYGEGLNTLEIAKEQIITALSKAREKIIEHANLVQVSPSKYACTLMVIIFTKTFCCTGHVGDGAVVLWIHDEFKVLSPPDNIEYINQVVPITSPKWNDHLRISVYEGESKGVAAFTDGCQRAALIRKDGEFLPYAPFLSPIFNYVKSHDERNSHSELMSLLQSDLINQSSDDDKTMVIGIII